MVRKVLAVRDVSHSRIVEESSSFNVDAKGNELLRRPYNNPEKLFWWIQLPKLKNLVQLNLNLITTDYILMLMGRECPKLEVVNIVSRIGQVRRSKSPYGFCENRTCDPGNLRCRRLSYLYSSLWRLRRWPFGAGQLQEAEEDHHE